MRSQAIGEFEVLDAKFKTLFVLFLVLPTNYLLVAVSQIVAANTSVPTFRYLSDPDNDSTRPELAPWGEIVEVWVEADAIIIKSKGIMNFTAALRGHLLLFFDEDLDNRTDVVFRYTKYYSSQKFVDYCHLYRFSNGTYYHDNAWNYDQDFFGPKTEENETLGETTFHLGGAISGEMKLKVASFYMYDGSSSTHKVGGDLVPNSSWDYKEVGVSPPNLETYTKLVNDTRFQYPNETLILNEPEVLPPPPLTISDYLYAIQNWIASNPITVGILAIFSIAAVYSIISRRRQGKRMHLQG